MESKGTAVMILVVTVAGVFIAYPLLIGLGNQSYANEIGILYISILGNSSDIVYPELGGANFKPDSLGGWSIQVEMVNDSEGYENVNVYASSFTASNDDVTQIYNSLFHGLNISLVSTRTTIDLLNSNASIGYLVDIIFDDNTWIHVYTFLGQNEFLLLNGTYTGTFNYQAEFPAWSISRDTNMLNGICLESISVLDPFENTLHRFFANYLG
ncbi:MAG: hypothetical protein AM326_05330 [Candidatus Thorarchaeota archaeon SMTZ-45]|nr:MAG: hypothetical protein AM326_05330 [Candidatus Thorarchaeota archaeon SMTZ-45]